MTGKLKKLLLPNLPYLLFVWLFDKLCQAVRLAPGANASDKEQAPEYSSVYGIDLPDGQSAGDYSLGDRVEVM